MKFISYLDEFGDTQYLQPDLVTHTQAHHFFPKDEDGQVDRKYRGTLVGLGKHGYVISKEHCDDLFPRILEALNAD